MPDEPLTPESIAGGILTNDRNEYWLREQIRRYGREQYEAGVKAERGRATAEREEWNAFCGLKHPEGSPPLTPKDARLMRAIFNSD